MKKVLVLAMVMVAPVLGITIDGDFADWDSTMRVDVNPIPVPEVTGDHSVDPGNPAKYVDTDLYQIYVTDDTNYIYFYLTFNDSANLYNLQDTTIYNGAAAITIFFDLDGDSATGLTWGWWGSGYDFAATITHTPPVESPWGPLPDAFGLLTYDQTQHPNWGFNPTGDTAIVSISADEPYNKIEAAIPKATISGLGRSIRFLIVTQEQLSPWGGDYAPDPDKLGYQVYSYSLQNLPDAGITIDGDFSDWAGITPLGAPLALYNEVEPVGDHSVDSTNLNKYVDTDIDGIYVASDADYLYFYIDFNSNGNLYNLQDTTLYNGAAAVTIFIDVDNDSSTGLTWGWWISGYDFAATITHTPSVQGLPDAFGLYTYDQSQHPNWGFTPISDTAIAAISVDEPYNKIECAIPRSAIPDLPEAGGIISVLVVAQEQLGPWGGDYAPDAGQLGYQKLYVNVNPVSVEERRFFSASSFRIESNPITGKRGVVSFSLPISSAVDLSLYDVSGRKVKTILNGNLSEGTHRVVWRTDGLQTGAYVLILRTEDSTESRRVLVIR